MSEENVLPVTTEMPISDLKFTDSLSEDIRGEASLQNFKDVNSLAKSYVSAQKMIGSSLRIPTDDAAPEVRSEFYNKLASVPNVAVLPAKDDKEGWAKFYNNLGRPDSADKYTFNVDENLTLDSESVNSFKSMAHEIGLTNAQADAIMKFELGRNEKMLSSAAMSREAGAKALQEAFGNDFDNRIASAKETVKHYGAKHPEALKALLEGDAGNNPIVVMMAAELGKMYKESGAIEGTRKINFGMTPEEARQRISEIRDNPNHAYYDDRNPGHTDAVEYMRKLYGSLG